MSTCCARRSGPFGGDGGESDLEFACVLGGNNDVCGIAAKAASKSEIEVIDADRAGCAGATGVIKGSLVCA